MDDRTQTWRCRIRLRLLLAVLACLSVSTAARPARATTAEQDALIQVLFGDPSDIPAVDANNDGALTVADIVLLGQPSPPPTATPTSTSSATETPTPTPTQEGVLFSGTVADLLPHGLNDQLVYRVTDPTGKVTTETTTVTSVNADGTFIVDDLTLDGQVVINHQTRFYRDTGTQLFVTGGTDVTHPDIGVISACDPHLLQLMMPVVAGETFSTTSVCDVSFIKNGLPVGTMPRTDMFTPKEIVDSLTVSAGTFTSVVHITGNTNLNDQLETDEIYLVPGVGAVLRLQIFSGQTYRYELISGTIGGHPVGS